MLSPTTTPQLIRRMRELNAEIERSRKHQRLLEAEAKNLEMCMEVVRFFLFVMERKPRIYIYICIYTNVSVMFCFFK